MPRRRKKDKQKIRQAAEKLSRPPGSDLKGKLPEKERIIERRAKIWKLRRQGYSVSTISKNLDVSESTVYSDLKAYTIELCEMGLSDANVVRTRQIDQVANMLQTLYERLRTLGTSNPEYELKVIDKILALMDRESKLAGADKPLKVTETDVTGEKNIDKMSQTQVEERLTYLFEKARLAQSESTDNDT